MEATPENLAAIATLLQQTLHPATRKNAETQLQTVEKQQNFSVILLQLVGNESADPNVRFAAVLLFKNMIKRLWPQAPNDGICDADRDAVKRMVVPLMISVPEKLQLQLSEAVAIMAAEDFPDRWENLITDLVGKLSPTDYRVNAGVLQTLHSIFKRYRHQFRTNELFLELKFVLGQVCVPYRELLQNTDELIVEHSTDQQALKILFQSLHLMCKIFYSLNSQDIPEFFEDNQELIMTIFLKYLTFSDGHLLDEGEEAGTLEKVKTSICEIVDLYVQKYEDVFALLPQFVQKIWGLLTALSLEPKNDLLASTAISVLSSVAKHARHRYMFESADALRSICQNIILPNIQLRESDEELFEDDPIEYIRRDLEGSDSDTRRRSATDLVRSLSEQFDAEMTALFSEYINHYLQEYAKDPIKNWKAKDAAIYMIIAITAKAATSQLGATKTNAAINIAEIFSSNVLSDLQAPVNAITPHPVLKVDAIKFLSTFRHQLSKEQLSTVFPLIVAHLTSQNYVVHTYAAVCIERILFMKIGTKPMFNPEDLKPYTETLLTNLFKLIEAGETPEKMSENDYLIKTVMRVIYIARQDMAPYVTHILERLTKILQLISKNPSNPKFNHFVFEAIGSLVRFVCASDPKFAAEFEKLLFPPFQAILASDIQEFTPYVFQILSQLFEYHQEKEIPALYQPLLQPLLMPSLWESHGNVPALVRLLQAYLTHGGEIISNNNQLPAFLGIFQKLVASRLNDHYGFDLLLSIFQNVPQASMQQYQKQVFNLILVRLQSGKTSKYTNGLLKFLVALICSIKSVNMAQVFAESIDSFQPKLFSMLLTGVLLPEVKTISSSADRKACCVALTKILTQTTTMSLPEYESMWPAVMTELVCLLKNPLVKDIVQPTLEEEELYGMDAEEAGYQSAFARLHSIAKSQVDYAADIQDLNQFVRDQLNVFMETQPHIKGVLNSLDSELKLHLKSVVGLAF